MSSTCVRSCDATEDQDPIFVLSLSEPEALESSPITS